MAIGKMRSSGVIVNMKTPGPPKVSRAALEKLYPGCYAAAARAVHRAEVHGHRSKQAMAERISLMNLLRRSPNVPNDIEQANEWIYEKRMALLELAARDGAA